MSNSPAGNFQSIFAPPLIIHDTIILFLGGAKLLL